MTPIRWPRLQSPALGTDSGTACDQRAILYMLYIRLIDMFKTGNISSDPDTTTHTPAINSRTPPEVDQSLIPKQRGFSRLSLRHLPTIECDVCGRLNKDSLKFTTNTLKTICEPCIVQNPEWIKVNTTTEKPNKEFVI